MTMLSPQTVAFHTFGCKVNQYETEELRGQLQLGGFSIVPMDAPADVYVINSCSVTADADSSCRQLVRKMLREHPASRVVVTGCYAERAPDDLREISPQVEVFGNREKSMIAVALGVPTACIQAAAASGVTALADRTRAYIKVQDGCDAHCTYCIIPRVRPDLLCREPASLIHETQMLVERGFHEIVLTGVRLGRYDALEASTGTRWNLVDLLKALLNMPGEFRIRLSSIEVTEITEDLIALMANHPKLCAHFHIPLQSGDEDILKRMGRWYTAKEYRETVHLIKSRIPDVALTADVIVGFPGEGETHFQNSARLLEEEGFSRLHVFRYSVRPGTPAERLKNTVDPRTKSARSRTLTQLDQLLRVRFAGRFLDRSLQVLLEADGLGYTERYVRVQNLLPSPSNTFLTLHAKAIDPQGVLQV